MKRNVLSILRSEKLAEATLAMRLDVEEEKG